MNLLEYQPRNARSREEYLGVLRETVIGLNTHTMLKEEYDYNMMNSIIIYQGPGFFVYKWCGNEFVITKEWDVDEYAFFFEDFDEIKVKVDEDGELHVVYDPNCDWPTILDYIERDGFPIPFKIFHDYGLE